jgi:hypothetical protein
LATLNRVRSLAPGLLLTGLIALFAVIPLLGRGLPNTADGPAHLFRAVELHLAWQDGIYYPRWAPDMAFGYGAPHFNYAPPLPYFLTGLLHMTGLGMDEAMKGVVILSLFLYAYGMYLFARDILGPGPALVSAAAYVLIPYRLREVYIQGNFGQTLGLAFLPWIMWGARRAILAPGPGHILAMALAYAALLLSHNISAMLFIPLLGTYVLFILAAEAFHARCRPLPWEELARGLTSLAIAFALGLGLAAIFWLPAFGEQHFIQLGGITSGFFDFRRNFVTLAEVLALPAPLDYRATNPYFPLSAGVAPLLLSTFAVLGLLRVALRSLWQRGGRGAQGPPVPAPPGPHGEAACACATGAGGAGQAQAEEPASGVIGHTIFFAVAFVLCLFMTLPGSTPLWESGPLLPLAEFPWRWLGPASLCAAFLCGAALPLWGACTRRGNASALPLAGAITLILLATAPYLFPRQPFISYPTLSAKDVVAYEVESGAVAMTSSGEFLPIWAVPQPNSSPLLKDYQAGKPIDKFDRSSLPDGASAEQLAHNAVSDRFRVSTSRPFLARLHTLYFPGWRAYLDGQEVPIKISRPGGFIQVQMPAGSHDLLLRFENTPIRTTSEVIFAISLLASLVLGVLAILKGMAAPVGQVSIPAPEMAPITNLQSPHCPLLPRQALWLGCWLLALLALKELWIGPHTSWFRVYSPPGQVLGMEHAVGLDFGVAPPPAPQEVRLLGYDLSEARPSQGQTLQVTLYWQANRPLDRTYSAFVHLDTTSSKMQETRAGSDHMHPGGIPTWRWHTALYVRDVHTLTVPDELLPGIYTLRVGLYDRESGAHLLLADGRGDTLTLQEVRVVRARPLEPSRLPNRIGFRFADAIELLGYDLGTSGEAPPILTVTLYWRALAPTAQSYTVFVHAIGPDGALWGQGDSIPSGGIYPTNAWPPGEVIEDRHIVPLAPEAPPGAYRVAIGLYLLETLQRLPAYDAEGHQLAEGRVFLPRSIEVSGP